MKQEKNSDLRNTRWQITALQLSMVGLLSACGGGTPTEPMIGAASEPAVAGPSISAAQLSNDSNYSISFAQAVAVGTQAAPTLTTNASIIPTPSESAEAPTPVVATSAALTPGATTNESNTGTVATSTNTNGTVTSTSVNTPATESESGSNVTESPTPVEALPVSETPAIAEALPVTESETPIPLEELPVTDSETATTDTAVPVTDSETATTDTAVPVTDSETATIDTALPVTDSETATTDTAVPVTDSETAATDTTPPITDSESPATDTVTPSMESEGESTETATDVAESEPPTDDTEPTDTDEDGSTTVLEPTTAESDLSTTPDEETQAENPTPKAEQTDSGAQTTFSSSTTEGFNGEVLSDSIRVTWQADPDARGYNIYRQAEFVTSVFTEEYIDEDVFDSNYYYEIQAFNNSDELYYVAKGLTVKAQTFGRTDPDAPVPNTQLLDGYDLVFGDEFNGETLDSTKWNTSYLWGTDIIINSEEQFYVDINNDPDFGFNPFTFDGNNLTINSIKTPDDLTESALNQPYLSGVITSYDAFKFTYGYVETRAKVTLGRGYWPAFWLLNAYYVDASPEIDIMEFIGHNQDVVYHTYHYYDSEGKLRSTKSNPTKGIDFTADFHTYAVEWKPGTIIFYVDSIEVHRVVDPEVSQQEMYVIANTALGGWWAGSPDNTTPFPGEFVIDYIRVYQKSQPYDDVLFNDGISQVPYADQIFGNSSPSHRPSLEEWPAGYPSGQ